jgi:hypothetical protein
LPFFPPKLLKLRGDELLAAFARGVPVAVNVWVIVAELMISSDLRRTQFGKGETRPHHAMQ